jgi:hypothetical protein
MAVGMAMAQQMMNQPAASWRRRHRGGRAAGSSGRLPETLGPATRPRRSACPRADVIASLEAGDLKGKTHRHAVAHHTHGALPIS